APHGFAHAAAALLRSPGLPGFPGALHVYRSGDAGAFTTDELRKLKDIARQLSDAVEEARASRRSAAWPDADVWLTPRPQTRQFVFDSSAEELVAPAEFEKLDHRLRDNLVGHVQSRVEKFNGEAVYGHRIQFPD